MKEFLFLSIKLLSCSGTFYISLKILFHERVALLASLVRLF